MQAPILQHAATIAAARTASPRPCDRRHRAQNVVSACRTRSRSASGSAAERGGDRQRAQLAGWMSSKALSIGQARHAPVDQIGRGPAYASRLAAAPAAVMPAAGGTAPSRDAALSPARKRLSALSAPRLLLGWHRNSTTDFTGSSAAPTSTLRRQQRRDRPGSRRSSRTATWRGAAFTAIDGECRRPASSPSGCAHHHRGVSGGTAAAAMFSMKTLAFRQFRELAEASAIVRKAPPANTARSG